MQIKFPEHYNNRNSDKELLACFSEVVENKIISIDRENLKFIGIAVDDATDVASLENCDLHFYIFVGAGAGSGSEPAKIGSKRLQTFFNIFNIRFEILLLNIKEI